MAQLHAREAPDRVRELQEWGAVFDRIKEGGILQRASGGAHTYPGSPTVGDRTGLEMIRTLQDKGVHQGIDVFMECTLRSLLKERRERIAGGFGYWRETGPLVRPVQRAQGGGPGNGRDRPLLGRELELVGIHRRRSRHGPLGRR